MINSDILLPWVLLAVGSYFGLVMYCHHIKLLFDKWPLICIGGFILGAWVGVCILEIIRGNNARDKS